MQQKQSWPQMIKRLFMCIYNKIYLQKMSSIRKIMFLGESGTGKTAYISYILHDRKFQSRHLPTPGVEAGIRCFVFKDQEQSGKQQKPEGQQQQIASVQFWDTAGKHSFHDQICLKFYHDMDAFIILIDCSDENTLKSVNYWRQKIIKVRGSLEGIKIGVIANKSDLRRQYSVRQFKDMHKGIDFYREVSLKEETEEGKESLAQQAILEFIRYEVYENNLPKICLDSKTSQPVCNCSIM